jgi:hypothetical protein
MISSLFGAIGTLVLRFVRSVAGIGAIFGALGHFVGWDRVLLIPVIVFRWTAERGWSIVSSFWANHQNFGGPGEGGPAGNVAFDGLSTWIGDWVSPALGYIDIFVNPLAVGIGGYFCLTGCVIGLQMKCAMFVYGLVRGGK